MKVIKIIKGLVNYTKTLKRSLEASIRDGIVWVREGKPFGEVLKGVAFNTRLRVIFWCKACKGANKENALFINERAIEVYNESRALGFCRQDSKNLALDSIENLQFFLKN